MNENVLKLFSNIFTYKSYTIEIFDNDGESIIKETIYDAPTLYFLGKKDFILIYGKFEDTGLNEIVKQIKHDNFLTSKKTPEIISQFRSYFYKHPSFISRTQNYLQDFESQASTYFLEFLKLSVQYNIYSDKDIQKIKDLKFYFPNAQTLRVSPQIIQTTTSQQQLQDNQIPQQQDANQKSKKSHAQKSHAQKSHAQKSYAQKSYTQKSHAQKQINYNKNIGSIPQPEFIQFRNILGFDRFFLDGGDERLKNKAQEVIDELYFLILQNNDYDFRQYQNYRDRDKFPDKIVSQIEKLVLYNYNLDEDAKKAIKKINLDLAKEGLGFRPRGRQKYMLVMQARENIVATSRRCMRRDSRVRMADGSFKLAKDLKIGDRLLASDGKSEVIILNKRDSVKETREIELENGVKLYLSGDHRVPTEENFSRKGRDDYDKLKPVEKLKVGDFLAVKNKVNILDKYKKEIPLAEAELIGYLIGDGSLGQEGVTLTKYNYNEVEKILNLVSKIPSIEAYYNTNEKKIHFKNIRWLLEKYGLYKKKSKDKFISSIIFQSIDKVKIAFLQGLFNTDLYIAVHKNVKSKDGYNRKDRVTLEYSSISEQLIKDLYILLNDLGILCTFRKKVKKIRLKRKSTGEYYTLDNYIVYYLYIYDRNSIKRLLLNLDLRNKKNYFEAIDILTSDNQPNINGKNHSIPLIAYKKDRNPKYIQYIGGSIYFGKDEYITRIPRYNFQRWKAYALGLEHWLEYDRVKIKSIKKLGKKEKMVDIQVTGDNKYMIENVIVSNCGKSFLSMYLAIRQFFIPGQMIIYIIPSKEGFSEQPFFYAKKFVENIQKKGWTIDGISTNAKDFKLSNNELGSKINFVSAMGSNKGARSYSANLVVMDEAAYVMDDKLYDVAYATTATVKGMILAVSTINIDTPVNWFYYKKIDLEGSQDGLSVTVNLYDNLFISDYEKKQIEKKYKNKDPLVWNCEWMAIFNTEKTQFAVDKFFIIDFDYTIKSFAGISVKIKNNLKQYERFIIGLDPARDKDKSGVAVLGFKNGKAEVIAAFYVDYKDYIKQAEVIVQLYEFLQGFKRKVDVAIDLGKGGQVMFDYYNSKGMNIYGISSTAGKVVNRKSYREYFVPKKDLEDILATMIDEEKIKGFSFLDDIRIEFDTYQQAEERKADHHHDILSALMVAIFIAYQRHMLQFKEKKNNQINKEDINKTIEKLFSNKPQNPDMSRLQRFIY